MNTFASVFFNKTAVIALVLNYFVARVSLWKCVLSVDAWWNFKMLLGHVFMAACRACLYLFYSTNASSTMSNFFQKILGLFKFITYDFYYIIFDMVFRVFRPWHKFWIDERPTCMFPRPLLMLPVDLHCYLP